MSRKMAALAVAFAAAALAACAGGSGGNTAANGTTYALPGMPDLTIIATLPKGAHLTGKISTELPGEGLGRIHDRHWKAMLGGYTQERYSQALGFPPGTAITIRNVSQIYDHTLNVVAVIDGPPTKFPSNPKLGFTPSGGKLRKGYASGVIGPNSSVTVTLGKPGIYLIGCAYHYNDGMRDVLVVAEGATPGPEATAPRHR